MKEAIVSLNATIQLPSATNPGTARTSRGLYDVREAGHAKKVSASPVVMMKLLVPETDLLP